jgi:transcriptional regulator with XRE-family HTH domain
MAKRPKEDYAKEIGKRLKDVRESLKIRQADLAETLGLTKNTIYLYEKGKRALPIEALVKISSKYRVDPRWLTTGHGSMFLPEELARPSKGRALEKEQPHLVSKEEDPELYCLVTVLKKSKPKEKSRFVKMALSFFEEEKRGRS